MRSVIAILDSRRIKDQLQIFCTVTWRSTLLNVPSKLACLSFLHRAAWLILECTQPTHSTAHPPADIFHPPFPQIASRSISRTCH